MGIEVYLILLIIGTISFLIWRATFKKVQNPVKRRVTIWTLTVLSAPIIYFVGGYLLLYLIFSFPNRDFEEARWKKDHHKRYELTKDLIDSKILIGKSKNKVEMLLGSPDSFNENEWVYEVGTVPGISNIDIDIIVIRFKDDKAINITQRGT